MEVQQDATAEYTIYQMEGEPKLTMRPATRHNHGYFNGMLRRIKKNRRALQSMNINIGMLDETMRDDRELYARHVVCGWSGLTDSAGTAVPFSASACRDFLEALPDWIFEEIQGFASEITNFIDDAIEPDDVEDTAKN